MFLTKQSRQRDVERRGQAWEERIGEEAVKTTVSSYWYGQFGYAVGIVWLVATILLAVVGLTGGPIVAISVVAWPILIGAFIQSLRLLRRAEVQAGSVAGTSDRARPPVRNLTLFDRWSKENEYSRYKASGGFVQRHA
jgi:hypothetical protein